MDTLRWRRISALFERAMDLALDARDRMLDAECAGDIALRAEVDALLRQDGRIKAPGSDLHALAADAAAQWAGSPGMSIEAGSRVGPWLLRREIGVGGMGMVFLAERADGQFSQQCALKLIRHSLDSESVRLRFLRERQILAGLEHPHIAHLIDGGVTPDGRPYFAMEYVEGAPLKQWCDAAGANLERRLSLFLDVCDAVQFAHQRLILHRDLKPGNVLVDGGGRVKLLDFGIARMLSDEPGDGVTLGTASRALTPGYAAPEQWRGERSSTATDVYSLGVMLFELLAGVRPFQRADGESCDESDMAMRDAPAPPLASRVGAAHAGPVPAGLLRGDLDAILRRALAADLRERYATVEAFTEDLRRYQARLPVAARSGVFGYALRRFVTRHRTGVAIAVMMFSLLAASTFYALHEASRARVQVRRAEAVRGLLEDVFRGADPRYSQGHGPSLRELLNAGAARLQGGLVEQPQLASEFAGILGTVYRDLGAYDRSETLLQQALKLDDRRDPLTTSKLYRALAETLLEAGKYGQAQSDLDHAVSTLRSVREAHDGEQARDLAVGGELAQKRGDYSSAERQFRQALALTRASVPSPNRQLAEQLNLLAVLLQERHQLAAARTLSSEALGIFRALYGDTQVDVAENLINLGVLDQEAGRFADAEAEFGRAARIYQILLPADHPRVAQLLADQARLYDREGQVDKARTSYEKALAIQRAQLGENHPDVAATLNNLGVLERNDGHLQRAAGLFGEVAQLWRKNAGPEHPLALLSTLNLAAVELQLDEAADAEAKLRGILEPMQQKFGEQHPAVARTLDLLGVALRVQGHAVDAMPLQLRALKLRQQRGNASAAELASGYVELAATALAMHRNHDAAAYATLASESLRKAADPMLEVDSRVVEAEIALAGGDPGRAAEIADAAAKMERARVKGEDWRSAEAELIEAHADLLRHRDEQARRLALHSCNVLAENLPSGHHLVRDAYALLASLPRGNHP